MHYGPFDIGFEDLGLDHLRAFLDQADEEGVNWEAKADNPAKGDKGRLRPGHIQRSACALANQVGGVVLIGAKQSDGEWRLPGVELPGEEPELWLHKAMRWLRPVPRYQLKVWELNQGRTAAVIEVEPLTQTPCMTKDGQVFERVSSESIRVTDPARLAELIRRGERARENAELLAARAADELAEHPDIWIRWSVSVVVAMAAASYEPDIASRLFHERHHRFLQSQAWMRLFPDGAPVRRPEDMRARIEQSFIQANYFAEDLEWAVRANWDGTVAVNALFTGTVASHYSLFDFLIAPAWSLCADLVEAAGGYGDARVHVRFETVQPEIAGEVRSHPSDGSQYRVGDAPPTGSIYAQLPEQTVIKRWGSVRPPSSEEIGSLQREFQRAAGTWTHEGEPDPPA